MLNESDPLVYKKILFPLFFSLTWAMLIYAFNINEGLPLTLVAIVTVVTFMYSLLNLWKLPENKDKVKILIYISVFAVVFHSTTGVINYYFQGIIATGYGLSLLVVFWKMLTKKK
ncbi:hypothetical protein AB4027_10535 [Alkalibacterium putridalgicola]|uniref:hypothetical protein n=1 Tax=Alkalibacterium putridalgicola TaxID=426703 RepID=UPI0034CDB2C1